MARRSDANNLYFEEQAFLGKTVGPYQVQSFLGRGGTAKVFKVLDLESGATRALKMTAAEPTDNELHRFKREFRVMSRLAHPNVISVHRYGVHESRPFFVMELIEGRDLRAFLRSTQDQPGFFERVAETFIQVARALAYIHDRHIVHRDLKPGNILVTHLGNVKVMDFGIAYEQDLLSTPTRSQTMMGTLAYVAPEQATGRKVDARADLYSLGVILYEILSGVKPFVGTKLSEMVYKHLHEFPPSPHELRPVVPVPLSELAMRLLGKKTHERPQSAQEVLLALEAWLSRDTQPPEPPPAEEVSDLEAPIHEPRLVGRERTQDALRAHLHGLAQGKGSLVLIVGEAGLGKTRFLEEALHEEVLSRVQVFSARCLSGAVSAYQALRDVVHTLVWNQVNLAHGSSEALTPLQATVLLRAFPNLEHLLSDIPPDPAVPSGVPDWLTLFTVLRGLLERLTETSPVLLTFDDLDQADEASLAVIQALIRTTVAGSKPRRLTVAGTCRPEAVARPHSQTPPHGLPALPPGGPAPHIGKLVTSPGLPLVVSAEGQYGIALGVAQNSIAPVAHTPSGRLLPFLEMVGFPLPPLQLTLEPLTQVQVAEMVGSMLAHVAELIPLAAFVHQQSEGLPIQVETVLRAMVAQGLLQRREHARMGCEWILDHEGLERFSPVMPDGSRGRSPAQNALQRRVQLLTQRDRYSLQLVATLDEPFDYEQLRLLTDLDEDLLLDFLDRMLKASLLVERREAGGLLYDFAHGTAREAIVAGQPSQERVLMHRHVGLILAGNPGHASPATIGHHLFEGHLYDEALEFLVTAGERAVRQGLYRRSMRPLVKAEEILTRFRVPRDGQDDSALRLRVDHALGLALLGMGHEEEAFECLTMALKAVDGAREPEVEAEIRTSLGHVHRERGEYRAAQEHYRASLMRLRQAGQSHRMGGTILGLGSILNCQGQLQAARQVFFEARELALELQLRPGVAGAVYGMGETAILEGNLSDGTRRLQEALTISRSLEDRPGMVRVQVSLAEALRLQGRWGEALDILEEAGNTARDYDLRPRLAEVYTSLGEVFLDLNATAQAESALNEAFTVCAVNNLVYHRAVQQRVWGILRERLGEIGPAVIAWGDGLRLAQGISAQLVKARTLGQIGLIKARGGQAEVGKRLLELAIAELRASGARCALAEVLICRARAEARQFQRQAALDTTEEVVSLVGGLEARDLTFRALALQLSLLQDTSSPEYRLALLKAGALLKRLLEGAGPLWRPYLKERTDISELLRAHPELRSEEP